MAESKDNLTEQQLEELREIFENMKFSEQVKETKRRQEKMEHLRQIKISYKNTRLSNTRKQNSRPKKIVVLPAGAEDEFEFKEFVEFMTGKKERAISVEPEEAYGNEAEGKSKGEETVFIPPHPAFPIKKAVVEAARPEAIEDGLAVASAAMAEAQANVETVLYAGSERKAPIKGKCYRCDKQGHFARDCRVKLDRERQQREDTKGRKASWRDKKGRKWVHVVDESDESSEMDSESEEDEPRSKAKAGQSKKTDGKDVGFC